MALCLCFALAAPAWASDFDNTINELYILSKDCPEEYIDFARETVGYMLWDHSVENPYLGTPFTFSNEDSDIYYFPIYSNGEIALTFRVHLGEDGEFSGVVSPAFADDLNAIASMTSLSDPLRIVYTNKDDYAAVMFALDDYEEEVQITPIVNDDKDIVATALNDEFEIINCMPVEQIQVAPSARASRNLNLSITETQSGNSWCLAYCAAIIARYNGTNTTAQLIMEQKYGKDVLTSQKLDVDKFLEYMHDGRFKTKEAVYDVNYGNFYGVVMSNIKNNSPIVTWMSGSVSNVHDHALVVRGYEDVKGTLSIWNPWYSYYETVYNLDQYVPATHSYTMYIYRYWYDNYRKNYNVAE